MSKKEPKKGKAPKGAREAAPKEAAPKEKKPKGPQEPSRIKVRYGKEVVPALMKHFKECIAGRAMAAPGGAEGIALMQMVEAIYKSSATGRSVQL